MNRHAIPLVLALFVTLPLTPGAVRAQKWVNPQFDAHRLDYRDLGYPDATGIEAGNSPITALLAAASGKAACLFVYDRSINKVWPLGRIGEAQGVHHALAQDSDGTLYIGGGLNMLASPPLTQQFPGGFRAIEEQLWKDISAPYAKYAGGHLYRYDPVRHDAGVRMPNDPCPLEDLGAPVRGNTIYALSLDARARSLYGLSYPDAKLLVWDLAKKKVGDVVPVLERIFLGESDRRASLFLFLPGGRGFQGGLNPSNPR